MSTPHINAEPDDFAATVIMPGDPLRAKYIAENYFDSGFRQVNDVRNMLAFTGSVNGKPLSVMGHGMGIPSVSIYATELFREFGVENIVRVGSCGAIRSDIALRDIVIAMGASTDSNSNRQRFAGYDFAALADYSLLTRVVDAAQRQGGNVRVGNLFTSDLFYTPDPSVFDTLEAYGILAVEMELAGLYAAAAECGGKAVGLCTVSDHIRRQEQMTSEERQLSFDTMIKTALDAVATL